jgi:hypothetical protein
MHHLSRIIAENEKARGKELAKRLAADAERANRKLRTYRTNVDAEVVDCDGELTPEPRGIRGKEFGSGDTLAASDFPVPDPDLRDGPVMIGRDDLTLLIRWIAANNGIWAEGGEDALDVAQNLVDKYNLDVD